MSDSAAVDRGYVDQAIGDGFRKSLNALREILSSEEAEGTSNKDERREAVDAREQYQHLHQEIAGLKEALRNERESSRDIERKLDRHRDDLEEERGRRKSLESVNRELLKEKEGRQGRMNVFRSIRKGLEEKIEELETSSREEKQALEKEIKSLRCQVSKLREYKEGSGKIMGNLEAQMLSTDRKVKDVMAERTKLLEELRHEKTTSEASRSTLERAKSLLAKTCDKMEAERTELQVKLQDLEQTIAQSAEEKVKLEANAQHAQLECARITKDLEETKTLVKTLKGKVASLECSRVANKDPSADETSRLQAQVTAKNSEIENKEKLIRSLRQRMEKSRAEHVAEVLKLKTEIHQSAKKPTGGDTKPTNPEVSREHEEQTGPRRSERKRSAAEEGANESKSGAPAKRAPKRKSK